MIDRYQEFKNVVELAIELCEFGDTYDTLIEALRLEELYQVCKKDMEDDE